MKKVISILLIIFGILIFCYPKLSEYYYDYQRKKIMRNLELNEKESNVFDQSLTDKNKKIKIDDKNSNNNSEKIQIQATVKIEKINLCQPILREASNENMKISITSVNINVKPGNIGNYALAGHRSYTYGRNFNRLDEVQVGDKVKISNGKKEYVYTIEKKFLVKPQETWVLNNNKKDREITLITCNPMKNPTHRLILKGRIK